MMPRWPTLLMALGVTILFGVAVADCGHGDTGPGYVDKRTGVDVVPSLCDHGNRVYYFNPAEHLPKALAVVPADPSCK